MTQEELFLALGTPLYFMGKDPERVTAVNQILKVVNKHVAEVIGEDEHAPTPTTMIESEILRGYESTVNNLRTEQRKRAGLITTFYQCSECSYTDNEFDVHCGEPMLEANKV